MNGQTRSPAPGPASAAAPLIRRARPGDAPALAAFNRAMAHETEHRDLPQAVVDAGVAAVLADPAHGFYVVAEVDGRVCAALLVTYEWSDWRNAAFWWIQSVYVVPQMRRRGLYRALYRHVREQAQAHGACGLRLYVEKDNLAAQNVYGVLGMRESGYRLYEQEFEPR